MMAPSPPLIARISQLKEQLEDSFDIKTLSKSISKVTAAFRGPKQHLLRAQSCRKLNTTAGYGTTTEICGAAVVCCYDLQTTHS